MKNILLILFLLLSASTQAQKFADPTLWGSRDIRRIIDYALGGPTGCGAPTSLNAPSQKSTDTMRYFQYFDSCNHRFYVYDPKLKIWDTIHVGAIPAGVDSITIAPWFWGVSGNSITSGKYAGTNNNQDFILKRNLVQAGRLGVSNTSFGVSALNPSISGLANNAFGLNALQSITSANGNNAFGNNVLQANTTGATNTGMGNGALFANTTGSLNVAIGGGALTSNTTGSRNTAIGNGAFSGSTGDANIAIGQYAGGYSTGQSQRLFINSINRSNAAGDSSLSLVFGVMDTTKYKQRLRINGVLQVDDGTQSDGYVMTTDANGVGSWKPNVGATIGLQQTIINNNVLSQDNTIINDGHKLYIRNDADGYTNTLRQQNFGGYFDITSKVNGQDDSVGVELLTDESTVRMKAVLSGSDIVSKVMADINGSHLYAEDNPGNIYGRFSVQKDGLYAKGFQSNSTADSMVVWDNPTQQLGVRKFFNLYNSDGSITDLNRLVTIPNAGRLTFKSDTSSIKISKDSVSLTINKQGSGVRSELHLHSKPGQNKMFEIFANGTDDRTAYIDGLKDSVVIAHEDPNEGLENKIVLSTIGANTYQRFNNDSGYYYFSNIPVKVAGRLARFGANGQLYASDSSITSISLGSDATGDIYYRNSSGMLARLPIGTTKQTLHVVGGIPAWRDTAAIPTASNGIANVSGDFRNTFFTGAGSGQTLNGATTAGGTLTIKSTTNATQGDIYLNDPDGPLGGMKIPGSPASYIRVHGGMIWQTPIGGGGSGVSAYILPDGDGSGRIGFYNGSYDGAIALFDEGNDRYEYGNGNIVYDNNLSKTTISSGETYINSGPLFINTASTGTNNTQAASTAFVMTNSIDQKSDLAAYQAMGSTIKAETVASTTSNLPNNAALSDNTLRLTAVYLEKPTTLTGIKLMVATQGSYTGDNENRVGLYSYSSGTLTLVASSSNNSTLWTATANTMQSIAFSSAYAAAEGLYFVGTLYNNSAQTTAPAFRAGVGQSNGMQGTIDFTNSAKIHSTVGSQNTLPSSLAMSSTTNNTTTMWVALY